MARRILKIAVSSAVAATFALGIVALCSPAQAVIGHCICPDIYAPVKCSNGRTYPNACVASCNKAKNCVPTGDI